MYTVHTAYIIQGWSDYLISTRGFYREIIQSNFMGRQAARQRYSRLKCILNLLREIKKIHKTLFKTILKKI